MIRFLGFILVVVCVSCGGYLPGKQVTVTPAPEVIPLPLEQRLYLGLLEEKYAATKKDLKLSIVRSMILEMEEKHPDLRVPPLKAPVSEIVKRPKFRSLELTIEHLSHREEVKLHARHSAFHAAP